jgi:ribonuclease P protein subunit POP4
MADSMPFTQELLTRAHSPTTAAQHHEDRVSRRPLHLRATSHVPSARAVRRIALNTRKANSKQRKTLKPRPLSAEQKRSLGLLEIPKAQQKYAIYEPLHNLWLGYMREILGVDGKGRGDEVERKPYVSAAGAGAMLASADMHGALVEVVRSRCVSRVGVRGIVVRDCKHVFEVVTSRNCVKCEYPRSMCA